MLPEFSTPAHDGSGAGEPAIGDAAALRKNIAALLKNVGDPGVCRGCKAEIWWMVHRATGRITPYNQDGANHFIDCPDRESFRKRRG